MDLGINGRKAIVCGSSKGLGFACAQALAEAGVDVLLNARSADELAEARQRLSDAVGRPLRAVVADVTLPEGRRALIEAMPDPDILVTNVGGPPPGRLEDWDVGDWERALNANMIAPIELIKAVIGGMQGRKWGRILNITSSAVKQPIADLGLSNGARTGLTGFVAGLSRRVARDGVTINNLLPGSFETDRLRSLAKAAAEQHGLDIDTVFAGMATSNPTQRVGQPREFGAACAFLASEHAGYIVGQNILLDGGAFPGTM